MLFVLSDQGRFTVLDCKVSELASGGGIPTIVGIHKHSRDAIAHALRYFSGTEKWLFFKILGASI